ncbi:MAG: hypothetical protein KDJ67_13675 [Nitratireductor sp.]|nr:hypothetical protein [Nitratireductor sp.]
MTMAGAAVFACIPVGAKAGETPPFLSGGQFYGENTLACDEAKSGAGEGEGLYMKGEGVFGTEWGCTFVDFLPIRYEQGGEISGYIAITSCGDDSGVSRPDMFELHFYEDVITATSQNDYVAASAKPYDDKEDPFSIGIINKQFALCKK